MAGTTENLWGSLYAIGSESDDVAEIPQSVIAKLIKLDAVERNAAGAIQLSAYGRKLYKIMETGNDVCVPGFDDPAGAE